MAKINSTYNAGYYYDKDVDIVAFNAAEEKLAKQKEKEKRRRLQRIQQKGGSGEGVVTDGIRVRQTFAVPFHTQCLHCGNRIARGVHVYMNRYKAQGEGEGKTELGLDVWEIQFRCPSCSKHIYIRTDNDTPEKTGGYIPYKHCKRFAGDFLDLYKKEAAKAAEDAIEAAKAAATMSEAEQRGLANKARQEEQAQLDAIIKRRSALSAEELLERFEEAGKNSLVTDEELNGSTLLPLDDFEDGTWGPSDSDEEDPQNRTGQKRERSVEESEANPRAEHKPHPFNPSENAFLNSLGAVLGNTAPPLPPLVQSNGGGHVETPSATALPSTKAPAKKKTTKLKGAELVGSYFS